jgi:hypothetical protein
MRQVIIGTCVAVLLLSGDVRAETDSVQGPDGRMIHETTCQFSNKDCYQEARQTCRGNYQVMDSYSSAGGIFADQIPGPIKWFHMTYACGTGDGRIARFPQQGGTWQAPRPVYLECGGNRWNRSCGGFY